MLSGLQHTGYGRQNLRRNNKLFLFAHLTHLQMWGVISFIVLLVRTPRKRAFLALTLTRGQSQARCVASCCEVQRGAWQRVGAKEVLAGGRSFATTFRMILTYQKLRKETNSFAMQHTSNFMFDNRECWELYTEWILPLAFSRKSQTIHCLEAFRLYKGFIPSGNQYIRTLRYIILKPCSVQAVCFL